MAKLEEKSNQKTEELSKECKNIRIRLEQLEQYGFKYDVVVCGIDDDRNNECEDVIMEKIIELAKKLKTELVLMEISDVHRLPTKNDNNAHPILVRLNSLRKKTN